VKHRGILQGIGVAVAGLALALAPLGAASAKEKPKVSTKTICRNVKAEQAAGTATGAALEHALASGNFATAKQALLKVWRHDVAYIAKALAVVKSAPANVQAAFKDILKFAQQIKTDIQNASSEQQLLTSFESLGSNKQLQTDGATIGAWFASKCAAFGGTLSTTPTT
jgi:hypothetical protein